MAGAENTPTSVYLYYDENELLLYVGITSRAARRQYEHNRDKDWWQFVATQKVEHYPSKPDAATRERELIEALSPPFNTKHNTMPGMREAYLAIRSGESIKAEKPAGKRIPMRIVDQKDGDLTLVTRPEWSSLTARIEIPPLTDVTIGAGGKSARNAAMRRIGHAIALNARTKAGPACIGGSLMYKYVDRDRLVVKRVDLDVAKGGH